MCGNKHMTFDAEMTKGIYRVCLGKGWTIDELYEDVGGYIMDRGTSVSEWVDNFCMAIERYKQ